VRIAAELTEAQSVVSPRQRDSSENASPFALPDPRCNSIIEYYHRKHEYDQNKRRDKGWLGAAPREKLNDSARSECNGDEARHNCVMANEGG